MKEKIRDTPKTGQKSLWYLKIWGAHAVLWRMIGCTQFVGLVHGYAKVHSKLCTISRLNAQSCKSVRSALQLCKNFLPQVDGHATLNSWFLGLPANSSDLFLSKTLLLAHIPSNYNQNTYKKEISPNKLITKKGRQIWSYS